MSLCTCPERPRCEYHHCGKPADWSFFTPPTRWIKTWPHGRLHFMCSPCKEYYADAISKPLKGIDRPEGADDDWRPSIMDHLRHGMIALAFEQRNKTAPSSPALARDAMENYWRWYEVHRGFTPGQIEQFRNLRALSRKYFPLPGAA